MIRKMRIGHFINFKSEPQIILVSGDKDSIYKLELVFRNLSNGNLQSVIINKLDFVQRYNGLEINALLVPKDIGIIRQNNNSFTWSLCSETWESFAELISIFRSGKHGHHYLDCFSKDNTHIIISSDEYADDWVGWNKEG